MIYTVSKKFIIILSLVALSGFGFAQTSESEGFCKLQDGACCKGDICSQTNVMCEVGSEPVMLGCNEKCMAVVVCKKLQSESKINNNLPKVQILNNIKRTKIQKISELESKIVNIIPQAESLNYNTFELKNYTQNLRNIKKSLNTNLRPIEIREYNKELKNTMTQIKQELYDLKKYYKTQ